ncbi:MAG: hypothetical protein LBJ16_02895, partial [Holosporaceae bacterium]|nr:hypothetical protein [Holosporaceae bacterium]
RQPLWSKEDSDLVLKIRRENPTYGKVKIAVILRRDHGFKQDKAKTNFQNLRGATPMEYILRYNNSRAVSLLLN